MKVTLNENQLAHLSRLIKMKGVNFYDVNIEMTDHIASEVEEEIESSGLEYMKAVEEVFSRYGRFHFMNIEEEKMQKVQTQTLKQVWKNFLQFFTLPKIIITICLFLFFQSLIDNGFIEYILYYFLFLIVIIPAYLYYLKRKWVGKRNYLQLNMFHGGFCGLVSLLGQGMVYLLNSEIISQSILYPIYSTFLFLVLFIVTEIYINGLKQLRLRII